MKRSPKKSDFPFKYASHLSYLKGKSDLLNESITSLYIHVRPIHDNYPKAFLIMSYF